VPPDALLPPERPGILDQAGAPQADPAAPPHPGAGEAAPAAPADPVLCGHCGRTARNGLSCIGMCVADSGY
jgi:hypothetical protein